MLPTDTQPVASTDKTNKVPLAVGLTLGLLTVVIVTLGGVCYQSHRRRRDLIGLEAHLDSPYTVPPMTQAERRSSLRQNRKRPPQPDVPMATSTVGLSEWGPPPSYQSPGHDRSMGTAE
jgi:hypothetical protein